MLLRRGISGADWQRGWQCQRFLTAFGMTLLNSPRRLIGVRRKIKLIARVIRQPDRGLLHLQFRDERRDDSVAAAPGRYG